jgi:phospholipid-binding lipoprotein MlaA
MAEQRRQKTEDRSQKTEDRSQKSESCSLSSVLCSLAVVVFAVMTAGCAVSENSVSDTRCSILDEPRTAMVQGEPKPILGQPLAEGSGRDGLDENQESRIENRDEDLDLLEEELTEQAVEVADPLEPLNRLMFNVNDALYFWVGKPVVQVYKDVIPEPARVGIRNFFHNLTTPVRFANCLLQGKGDSANTELRRFLVNTTEGVLGFGDPAKDKRGLEPAEEDLGQTLAIHGIGNGFYIVLPLLGPSTLRDSAGLVGDQFLNPIRYVEPFEVSISISGGKITNEGSFHIGEYEDFKAAAPEPYVAMRQAYIQYRNRRTKWLENSSCRCRLSDCTKKTLTK